MKTLALTVAAGALCVVFAATGNALPFKPTSPAANLTGDVELVRDGCGRGWRFSNRRNRCVPMDRDSRRDDGGAAAAAVTLGIIGAVIGSQRSGNSGRRSGTQAVSSGSGKGGKGKKKN